MTDASSVWNLGDTAKFYAQARPCYSHGHVERLIEFYQQCNVGSEKKPPQLVLDVACGSGQFTSLLADQCLAVIGLDSSRRQIEQAPEGANLTFKVGSAYDFGPDIREESVDIITVAQAVHYLDLQRFYSEVKRCLRPGGVLCILGYVGRSLPEVLGSEAVRLYTKLRNETLGPFMPPGYNQLWNNYRDLPLPYESKLRYDKWLFKEFTLESLEIYIKSFSSFAAFEKEKPEDAQSILKPLLWEVEAALKREGKETFTFAFEDVAIYCQKPMQL